MCSSLIEHLRGKQVLIKKGNQKENRFRLCHVYFTEDKVLLKNAL